MVESKSLHFYTTGEGYMGLLQDMFESGEFYKYEQMLTSNFDYEQMVAAFYFKMELLGTTRDGEDLECLFLSESLVDFPNILATGVLTCIRKPSKEEQYDNKLDFFCIEDKIRARDRDILTLIKYISVEEIYSLCWERVLDDEGYKVTTLYEEFSRQRNTAFSGMLLTNGVFITCHFQGHIDLFPIVKQLKLVSSGNRDTWLASDAVIISSGMLSGKHSFILGVENLDKSDLCMSNEQLRELWKCREYNINHYSGRGDSSVNYQLLKQYVTSKGNGGKYGNLQFIKEFYPSVKTPEISLYYTSDVKTIVRTSPKYSLPGLLNSIVINNKTEMDTALERISSDYAAVKDLKKFNDIYWFFQEFIEGVNGVVNCIERYSDDYPKTKMLDPEYILKAKYDIDIACSTVQGDIVIGKGINYQVGEKHSETLRILSRDIANTFKKDVQLEFVITKEDELIIVQFRCLDSAPDLISNHSVEDIKNSYIKGVSFSSPKYSSVIDVLGKDILVVELDSGSEALLDKKALIVTNNTNFSHILALSKALGIPSIYNTGSVDIDPEQLYEFNSEYVVGLINKK